MKFSSKLALAAVTTIISFSALADNVMPTLDYSSLDALAQAELLTPGTLAAASSYAVILQTASSDVATIQQTGLTNFAMILQTSGEDNAVAAIVQTGSSNTAYISQKAQ